MLVKICKTSEIEEGTLYRFDISDKPLLVTRVGSEYYAAETSCTHEEADLSLGIISGEIITCPLHHARFDVRSGTVISGPDEEDPSSINKLRTYKTKVENGELWVDLEQ